VGNRSDALRIKFENGSDTCTVFRKAVFTSKVSFAIFWLQGKMRSLALLPFTLYCLSGRSAAAVQSIGSPPCQNPLRQRLFFASEDENVLFHYPCRSLDRHLVMRHRLDHRLIRSIFSKTSCQFLPCRLTLKAVLIVCALVPPPGFMLSLQLCAERASGRVTDAIYGLMLYRAINNLLLAIGVPDPELLIPFTCRRRLN